jgi:hypothetical protein
MFAAFNWMYVVTGLSWTILSLNLCYGKYIRKWWVSARDGASVFSFRTELPPLDTPIDHSCFLGTRKDAPKLYKLMHWFAFVTNFIVVLDSILVITLAVDYHNSCTGNVPPRTREICRNGVVPVLVIVGRGGVFFVLNVVLAYRKIGSMAEEVRWIHICSFCA